MQHHRFATSVLLACVALVLAPPRASACGGFFCNSPTPTNPTPMNQAAEDIVYAVGDDGSLDMIVQIAYEGDAVDFAWILPVPSIPDVDVGSDTLFDLLRAATVPTFAVASFSPTTEGVCAPDPACDFPSSGFGCGASAASAPMRGPDGVALVDAGAAALDGGGVTVVARENIGPYDSILLSGGTAEEVVTYLMNAGYDIPAETAPLLEGYVESGNSFLALRLLAGRQTAELQPIALHFANEQPCLPIRLTALATNPDLPIRAFFLANGRGVPLNYSLIEPDYADTSLFQGITPYPTWIDTLVDEAGGHAWVTEYAGAPPPPSLGLPAVSTLRRETYAQTVSALVSQGYGAEPALLSIVARHSGLEGDAAQRAAICLVSSFSGCEVGETADIDALLGDVDATITGPRLRADALLASRPQLTRLYTSMSAEDMTLDPEFRIEPDLDPVSNVHMGTLVRMCDSAHYSVDAEVQLRVEGRSTVWQAAVDSSPEAFCARRGGTPRGSGCAASPGSARGGVAVAMLVLGALGVVRSMRRRRR